MRQVPGVYGVVTFILQPTRQPLRQLCIDEKIHQATAWMRFTWLKRAAYASTARMSSGSKSS